MENSALAHIYGSKAITFMGFSCLRNLIGHARWDAGYYIGDGDYECMVEQFVCGAWEERGLFEKDFKEMSLAQIREVNDE